MGVTAPDASPSEPREASEDRLPPYTPPRDGFWDTQPWESNVPLEQGPPPYEPLPPVLAELGPEYHDLQAQRYDNQTLAHEARTWQLQAAARDPREALDSAQEALADNPSSIPLEQLLTDPADKAAIERNLFDLDRPSPLDTPPHREFESSSQRLGSTRGLEHQQHTSDLQREQRWFDSQAQHHRQQAREMRDPQNWSEYHERQARQKDQQAAELGERSSTYRAAGNNLHADLNQYRQRELESQAQQHRNQAQKLREWDQWQSFKRTNRPEPVDDPDALDAPQRGRRWGRRNRARPEPAATPRQDTVPQLPHEDASRSAQALRGYAQHLQNQATDQQEYVDASRQRAAAETRTAQGHQRSAANSRRWEQHSTEQAERFARSAQQVPQGQEHQRRRDYFAEQERQYRSDARLMAGQASTNEHYFAYHQQEARGFEERADRAADQIPQLQQRAEQNSDVATQYELAAHRQPTPEPAVTGVGITAGLSAPGHSSTVVRDYRAISEGIDGMRRVVSQLELGSHELHQIQAFSTTEGQAAAALQQRLTQLRNVRRRMSDTTLRALDALDLANAEFRHSDNNLARGFSSTANP